MDISGTQLEIPFSELRVLEVLDYVDGPRIYSSVNQTGQIFFSMWIGETDRDSDWLYVPVSRERYSSIKSGAIDIRTAFLLSESQIVFRLTQHDDGVSEVVRVEVDDIDADWLPLEGDTLELGGGDLSSRSISTQQAAKRSRRQILDLSLITPGNAQEISLRAFSAISYRLQLLIDALGSDQTTNVRKVSKAIRDKNSLVFTEVFAGSFGIRLAQDEDSLFDDDSSMKALKSFLGLLKSTTGFESIKEELLKCNLISRARFLSFLEQLTKTQMSIRAEFSTVSGKGSEAAMPLNVTEHILAQLENLKSINSNEYLGRHS